MKFETKMVISLIMAILCLIGYVIGFHQGREKSKVVVEFVDTTDQEDYEFYKKKIGLFETMIFDLAETNKFYRKYAKSITIINKLQINTIKD